MEDRLGRFASSVEEENRDNRHPRLYTLELKQDDPAKNTSAKMKKFGLARSTSASRIPRDSIVLNPFAELVILPSDRNSLIDYGLVVIDCSWVHAVEVFSHHLKGVQRRLPALIAGNPTNYSKLGSLSSLEATAAALYVTNFQELAKRILSLYKWGETFLTLNKEPLDEYAKAETQEQLMGIELAYFGEVMKHSS